jgi:hypothetical protein
MRIGLYMTKWSYLIESDASVRDAVRKLNFDKGDIHAWEKAHHEAVRNGFLLQPEMTDPHWSRPTDGFITGVLVHKGLLVYAFEAVRSRYNHTMLLTRLKDPYEVTFIRIPSVLAHLVDDYDNL